MDHLDRAAGEAEGHPPERAGARPLEQVLGRGDEEALIRDFRLELVEIVRVRLLKVGRPRILVAGIEDHSHSSAPFFQASTRPMVSQTRKIDRTSVGWEKKGAVRGDLGG